MCEREGEEESEDGGGEEEVWELGEGPVVEESDVPVPRLDVGIYERDGLVTPQWCRNDLAFVVIRGAEENVRGHLMCDEWHESESSGEHCVCNLLD